MATASKASHLDLLTAWKAQLTHLERTIELEAPRRPSTTYLRHILEIQRGLESFSEESADKLETQRKTETLFVRFLNLSHLTFLVDLEQPVDQPSFSIALIIAARLGDPLSLEFLLEKMYARCLNVGEELGSALSQSVSKSHLVCTTILLAQPITIPHHHLCRTLPFAAENGDLATLDLLLAQGSTYPPYALKKALASSAKKLHNPCFRTLLELCPNAEGIEIKEAAVSLIKNHDMENLTHLLTPPRRLNPFELGEALCVSIQAKLMPASNFLLTLGPIDSALIGQACIEASKIGSTETLQLIFSQRREVVKFYYCQAAVEACKEGHFECVQFLLSEGRQMSKVDMGRALHAIMVKKHYNFFPFLFSACEELDEFDLILSYRDLAGGGQLPLLHFLAEKRLPQHSFQLTHAVKSAIIFNQRECALFLLNLIPELPSLTQQRLLEAALQKNAEDLILPLLEKRDLDQEARERFLDKAPQHLKRFFS